MLGETLGLELELEAQEKAVGPFRADILCRDVGNDHWVLIENQLERTNHGHLGQLLTYASGLEAVTIVWVAAHFAEEHRATLDWLNKITDDSFRFFGLEVELWRIGNSLAAPKFNIVSKPNDWSHAVTQAARAIDEADLSETRVLQRNYWAALNTVLDVAGGPVAGNKKPQPQAWMSFPIGRSRFHLNAVMARPRNQSVPSSYRWCSREDFLPDAAGSEERSRARARLSPGLGRSCLKRRIAVSRPASTEGLPR